MGEERAAWDELYRRQPRAWRGSSKVPDMGLSAGSSVLDVGCGNGKTSAALAEMGFSVTGVDFSSAAVDSCRERLGGSTEFFVSDCTDLPFDGGAFDGIYAVHVTEHLDDEGMKMFASECFRVLRPGGRMFVRSFSPGDMRAVPGNSVRNGISYRYRTPEDIGSGFPGFTRLHLGTVDEKTRFGTVRSRSECILEKP
ncbi:MAG: class I SAM-dependent methyltransferase [Candidatus Methanomethylophilaceae archaeon]|jgi:MPBQ/MSBQ methyltransferase|nr:class I SAM-dependent methyltransferase [Candidatus Methanomethylophilaceae archaeon]MDD2936019.1 class I SAM-dependent methyltransferase [Candidatus Methanomethylophilaceae archaeon]MDD3351597.1 class I SAM-dependent methyltransferase [Candidatus Methanomethylophilaceae archaeon]MDD3986815.1 class I SAM-dependent methyltransferase [Candidatus Methanomethylophilaceae archaeon]MDD4709417.1 class I SAM-dependent methyltransferase [Candidatus Methanomethylophilaceae archaeon]